MKYVIMTEGTCEKAFLDVLVERDLLNISIDSLLYEEIFHARQLKESIIEKIYQLPINETISIIRIGDKLSDELFIPDDLLGRIISNEKICIKPEFEILYLINLNLANNYLRKYKSKQKPSEYLFSNMKEYEKSYEFNYSYFNNLKDEDLIYIIKNYTHCRGGVHSSDEGYLEKLLK